MTTPRTTPASDDSRKKFFAFIAIGLLVAAATGVLVWKTSAGSGDSGSSEAGPVMVSKTPSAVNATASAPVTSVSASESAHMSPEAERTSTRSASISPVALRNDPLLPPHAITDGTGNGQSNQPLRATMAPSGAPATGIQETSAAESIVVEESATEETVLASPASTRTSQTQHFTPTSRPSLTPTAAPTTVPTNTEPQPLPSDEPTTDNTGGGVGALEPQEGLIPDTSAATPETTADGSPTDVIEEPTAPLLGTELATSATASLSNTAAPSASELALAQ